MTKLDKLIAARPASLTAERARSFLPQHTIDPEWSKRYNAITQHAEPGTTAGLLAFAGMLQVIWPSIKPTEEEARWILALYEHGTMRWVASIVLHGDSNQIRGSELLEAARRVRRF